MSASATVLIIEDDVSLRETLQLYMEREGLNCLTTDKGADGMALIERLRPDLVILDIMLPDLNGFLVCQAARNTGCFMPILMLTARTGESDRVQGLAIGADDYLTKPFSAKERLGLEAVIDRVVTGDRAQEYLIHACRETDYLSHLVEQLLLLAKADAGQLQIQPQAVSAVAIAQECIARIQPTTLQAGIVLELDTTAEPPPVWVDPALTGQVILNLLDNAIKYAGTLQRVCLNILPPVEQDGRCYVPLQVQDYGQGMTAEVLQQVTERFYRGDRARSRGGFGLGLAIVHQVCQLQGGHLYIESELNRGIIVTLLLPIAVAA